MAARLTTLRIALIVILIVAILIIVEASWSLQTIIATNGDGCACSGVSDNQLSNLRNFEILMLLVGIGIAIYAILMLFIPTSDARRKAGDKIRERFNRKTV